MDQQELNEQLNELTEQVECFFRRNKTDAQLQQRWAAHSAEVLASVLGMGEQLLREQPVYAAIAFLGRFEFSDRPEITSLVNGSSAKTLQDIRDVKALQVEEGAKPVWDALVQRDPEALCSVVALCYMATQNRRITRAIPSLKPKQLAER